MKAAAIIATLFLALPAAADIIEWQDADGVRHYTNLKSEIPKQYRDASEVVVDEAARHPDGVVEAVAPPPPEAERPRQAQAIYDRSAIVDAYVEGLERGLEVSRGAGASATSPVSINGPLAIANAAPSPYLPSLPYGYPLVTTSFDRGRSRHLTLRMLMQDQFALDREFFLPGEVPLARPVAPLWNRGVIVKRHRAWR